MMTIPKVIMDAFCGQQHVGTIAGGSLDEVTTIADGTNYGRRMAGRPRITSLRERVTKVTYYGGKRGGWKERVG